MNAFNTSFPGIPTNVTQSVTVLLGETVLLTLDISNDPDSPYLTYEDNLNALQLSV